jgi:hypothetical protein
MFGAGANDGFATGCRWQPLPMAVLPLSFFPDQAPMADGDGFVADLEGQPFDEAVVGVIPSRSRSQTTRSRGLHPPGRAEASRLRADAGSVGSRSIRVGNLDRRGTIRSHRPY